MDVGSKLRVIAECVRTLQGGEWSVREVLDIARVAGVKVREQEAYRILYSLDLDGRRAAGKRRYATSKETAIAAAAEEKATLASVAPEEKATLASGSISGSISEIIPNASGGSDSGGSGSNSQAQREAFHDTGQDASEPTTGSISGSISGSNSSLLSSPTPLTLISSFSLPPNPTGSPVVSNITRARAKKDPEDKAWIAPLESEARALAKFTLKALSRQQRFTLGRYHALRFGNCTVSEARNRRLGNQIAAGIAGLANSPLYGEITVKQYVNFAAQVHEQRGGAPWYDAWLLKAVVEFEA